MVSNRRTVAAALARAMPQARPSGIAGGDVDLGAGDASERGEAGPGANIELAGEGAGPAVACALAPALPALKPPWAKTPPEPPACASLGAMPKFKPSWAQTLPGPPSCTGLRAMPEGNVEVYATLGEDLAGAVVVHELEGDSRGNARDQAILGEDLAGAVVVHELEGDAWGHAEVRAVFGAGLAGAVVVHELKGNP